MKKKIVALVLIVFSTLNFIIFNNFNFVSAFSESKKVLLGGIPAGFSIETRGAFIAGLTDVVTKDGVKSPAKDAGLRQGDVIYYINDIEINRAADIEKALKNTSKSIEIDYYRCGNSYTVSLTPVIDLNGDNKLGVFIRDEVSGIGTITFIDGDTVATLGHPVLDENDELMKITGGKIYSCNITGFISGERGIPGELRGVIFKREEIGVITKNTEYGVFGKLSENYDLSALREIEIGEGKMGDAQIYTTVNGYTPKYYSVSIVKADNLLSETKNYVIKITDKELLDETGGIVQGMSGSPIIQEGKMIGAVTHVFINDPTRGFGISINNMINK
ncbi:MAG: PDZ domain-containing protein [Clostridia bacterium]|nr:PDZ domain-containing protein [Clostridia bacterium]